MGSECVWQVDLEVFGHELSVRCEKMEEVNDSSVFILNK